ncbi:MAG: FHA domain-containing protein [Planctomycetota bacterium]
MSGPQSGRVYVLKDLSVFDLGRGSGCQIVLEDTGVASHHARIYRKGEVWTFFDLNTEQGSSINDIPVEKRELAGGEIIRLGTTEFQFTFSPPTPKGAKPAPAPVRMDAPSSVVTPACLMVPDAEVHELTPADPPPMAPVGGAAAPAFGYAAPPGAHHPAVHRGTPGAVATSPAHVEARPRATPPQPVPAAAGQRCGLIIIDGDPRDVGRSVDLAGCPTLLIGRALDCGLVLNDGKVSRHHTRIEAVEGGHVILDLNSANGTVVNGQKVSRALLRSGDYVRLGFTVLAYELVPDAQRMY